MLRITQCRESKVVDELDNNLIEAFCFKRNEKTGLEYFPASIVESSDGEGSTYNDMRIFNEKANEPDIALPEDSMIYQMKLNRAKMLFCITMYNENFGQLLQSVAGCIRSIIELINLPNSDYCSEQFGIVLIWDGIDKVEDEFMSKLEKYNLFDPEICHNTVQRIDHNDDHVKRTFAKRETTLNYEK